MAFGILAWLIAAPAMAQQAPRAATPAPFTTPPPDAGTMAAPPQAKITARDALLITGSSTMRSYIEAASKLLVRDYHLPPPTLELWGTTAGIKDFCDGVGPAYPDILAASRRMHKDELDECVANDVRDIVEIKVGLTALYVVTKKGNPVFNVTPRMFYHALAALLPEKGEFDHNKKTTWRQVDKSAPDLPIRVLVPAQGSGTHDSFAALFMEAGCRRVKEIDAIYAAPERVQLCTTLRTDGVVTEIPEPYGDEIIKRLLASPPGTLAVIAGDVHDKSRDKADPLPVAGIEPTDQAIARFDYEMATFMYIYFKRAHMRNRSGVGVVAGIREFMAEVTREEMMGEGGVIDELGFVPLRKSAREEQRKRARTLQRFER